MKLFISNLAWETKTEDLIELFVGYGACRARVVEDDRGRSRGYGFIEIAKSQAAYLAIQRLDGAMLHGRAIRVEAAK